MQVVSSESLWTCLEQALLQEAPGEKVQTRREPGTGVRDLVRGPADSPTEAFRLVTAGTLPAEWNSLCERHWIVCATESPTETLGELRAGAGAAGLRGFGLGLLLGDQVSRLRQPGASS